MCRTKTAEDDRRGIIRKLQSEGREDWADKMAPCGDVLKLICTSCGHPKDASIRCKLRLCPVCAKKTSLLRFQRFEGAAARMQWPLAVTLTIRNKGCAWKAVDEIGKQFTAFRRTKFWKQTVKGGVASFEITNRGKGWHPHLHILCDCRWLAVKTPEPKHTDGRETVRHKLRSAQRELSSMWARATGQASAVVWVNRAWGQALKEVLKYNVKPADMIECKDQIGPLFDAMKGRRLIAGFGTLYKIGEDWNARDEEEEKGCVCDECQVRGAVVPAKFVTRGWTVPDACLTIGTTPP